jgi:hypothetical protein
MTRKLKIDKSIRGYIPVIASAFIFFFTAAVFSLSQAFNVLGGIMILFSLVFGFWAFYKFNNFYFLISTFYLIAFGLVLILFDLPDDFNNSGLNFTVEMKLALLFFVFSFLLLIYVGFQKKLKYRGSEVMEMAARDVEIAADTYTERPRPAGEVECSKYDIIDFGNHLKSNLICMPFHEENRVVLVPVKISDYLDFLFSTNFEYQNKTCISFYFNGQVSVHISREDYLSYRDDLAFDHLCESLGQLFITFADFYMRGDKTRIIDRLNSVKMGLFQ